MASVCYTPVEYCAVERQKAAFMCSYLFAKLASSTELGCAIRQQNRPNRTTNALDAEKPNERTLFSCGDWEFGTMPWLCVRLIPV